MENQGRDRYVRDNQWEYFLYSQHHGGFLKKIKEWTTLDKLSVDTQHSMTQDHYWFDICWYCHSESICFCQFVNLLIRSLDNLWTISVVL